MSRGRRSPNILRLQIGGYTNFQDFPSRGSVK